MWELAELWGTDNVPTPCVEVACRGCGSIFVSLSSQNLLGGEGSLDMVENLAVPLHLDERRHVRLQGGGGGARRQVAAGGAEGNKKGRGCQRYKQARTC